MDGGSSAAAVLAGAAAVVWSAYPKATVAQVLQRLRTTATDAGAPGADSRFGAGMLNLSAALAANVPQEAAPSVQPSPVASSQAASPSSSPVPVALADSRDWRRWLVALPLLIFLAGLTVWAVRSARVRQQAA